MRGAQGGGSIMTRERSGIAPVLEDIEDQLLNYKRPAPVGRASFTHSVSQDLEHSTALAVQHRFECNLLLRYRAWVSDLGPELRETKVKATRAFARQLYGPTVERLLDVEEELYAEGLQHSEVYKAITDLIADLSATFE
jgi:hypothetical protein